jgi:hypothetical protein
LRCPPERSHAKLVALEQAGDIDPELGDTGPSRHRRTSVYSMLTVPPQGETHRPALVELVALGVAAEIVVVVEGPWMRASRAVEFR